MDQSSSEAEAGTYTPFVELLKYVQTKDSTSAAAAASLAISRTSVNNTLKRLVEYFQIEADANGCDIDTEFQKEISSYLF